MIIPYKYPYVWIFASAQSAWSSREATRQKEVWSAEHDATSIFAYAGICSYKSVQSEKTGFVRLVASNANRMQMNTSMSEATSSLWTRPCRPIQCTLYEFTGFQTEPTETLVHWRWNVYISVELSTRIMCHATTNKPLYPNPPPLPPKFVALSRWPRC